MASSLRRWAKIFSVVAVFVLVASAFSIMEARADAGSAGDVNLAASSRQAVASASSTKSGTSTTSLNDGNQATIWRCAKTSGCSVTVKFKQLETFDEVSLHTDPSSSNYVIASAKVYVDKNSDGRFAASELVQTVTGNTNAILIAGFTGVAGLAVQVNSIVTKAASTYASIAEFEVYLRDKDLDGLSNGFEMSQTYSQDAAAADLANSPLPIADNNVTTTSVKLEQWAGIVKGGYANFSVTHERTSDLAVSVGYWDGSVWKDRYIWNPGGKAQLPEIKLSPTGFITGNVVFNVSSTNLVSLKEVRFYRDGALMYTDADASDPWFHWTWNTFGFVETTYNLELVAIDTSGNAISKTYPVTLDNTPATASITAPTSGQILTGATTVKVSASDNQGIAKVLFYIDSGTIPNATVTSPSSGQYQWNWDTTLDSDGSHTVKAVVYDFAGLTTVKTVGVTVNNGGGTPIRVRITNPQPYGLVSTSIQVDGTTGLVFPRMCQDIRVFIDGVLAGMQSCLVGILDQFHVFAYAGSLAAGYHFLAVRVLDTAGKTGGTTIAVQLDPIPPTASIVSPTNGGYLRGRATIKVLASDNLGVRSVGLRITNLGTPTYTFPALTQPGSDGYYSWNWDTPVFPYWYGPYTIEATATDTANAIAVSSVQVTVDNDAPTGYFQTPMSGAPVSGQTPVTVYASDISLGGATGGFGSASGVDRVEFLVDSALKFTDRVDPYTWTWDTTLVPNALHSLTARVYDKAGNTATFTIQVTVANAWWAWQPMSLAASQASSQSTLIAGKKTLDGATAASAYEALNYDGTPVTYNQVGVKQASSPGVGTVSGKTTVVVDLFKYIRDLTASEKNAGVLAPNYTSQSVLTYLRWRIQVFDLTADKTGVLNDFRITLIATTDPAKADTDGDGLKDGQEMLPTGQLKSLPVTKDTDNDGLLDGDEVNTYHSSPLLSDTDADGLGDYDEAVQYVPLGVTAFAASILPGQGASKSFDAPLAGYYMVKFLATTTVFRDSAFLSGHTIDDTSFIESSNDAFFRGLLTMKVDGVGAPSDTRGNLTVASYSGTKVNMTESRYFFVWDQSVQYSAGTHTLLLQLASSSDILVVRITAIEVNKKGLAITNPDADGDGLEDGQEVRLGTNPLKVDTDGDGLWDGKNGAGFGETSLGTDPAKADTDEDGVWDGYTAGNNLGELTQGTNPLLADTDGDGLWDGYDTTGHLGELSHGTLPLNPDTEGDTMWDGWELAYYLNPISNDALLDPDADGLTNGQEFTAETNPRVRDSDSDNLTDGVEASPVLLRTNIELGANTSAHYAKLLDWVAYRSTEDSSGHRFMFSGAYTNQTASSSPANSRKPGNVLVTILTDGSYVIYNATLLELYVWVPSADHGDLDHNGTGDGVLQGTYYRFMRSPAAESLNAPLPGYRGKEVYALSDPVIRDTDYDGIPDGDEVSRTLDSDGDGRINCLDPDSDNDGVIDGQEVRWASDTDADGKANMIDPDSDNDGILDGTEALWNVDSDLDGLLNMIDVDSDGDGLADGTEDSNHNGITQPSETSPTMQDTDQDGLLDSVEVNPYADADLDGYANANDADSDSDGLPDGNETNPYVDTDGDGKVNAYDHDADDDGALDGVEVANGSDPLRPDTDRDQLIDGPDVTVSTTSTTYNWFAYWGLPPAVLNGNMATFYGEQVVGADPTSPDSDSDGLRDGTERMRYGTSPIKADTDSDALPDPFEANPDIYWYEAEKFGTPVANNPDLATIATVPFMVTVPGNYRLYASAMGAVCNSVLILRILRSDSTVLYSETLAMPCNGASPALRWYSIRSAALASGQTYLLQARDDGAGHTVYVDKVMTARLDDLRVTTITPASFTLAANVAQSAQVQINMVPGIPLYVTQATMTVTGGPAMGDLGLSNGGFESDFTDWTSYGALIDYGNVHSGAKSADVWAYIDPYGGDIGSSSLSRTISVPSGTTRTAVRYYMMKAAQTGCGLTVSPAATLLTSGTWSYYEINVTAYAGSSVTITFSASCGSSKLPRGADYYIDDVTLMRADQYPVSPRLNVASTFDPGDPHWIYINAGTGDTLRTSVTTWDLSGDFNRYMFDQLNRNPTLTSVAIPLQVAATTNGVITFSNVNVVLGPRISDPTDNDTDSDQLPDGAEYRVNTSSLLWDSDHDAVNGNFGDYYEVTKAYTTTPTCTVGSITRTNPADIDTDGDGKLDGTDDCPVTSDTDNDGLRDSFERWIGTNPNDPDTDRDGLLDGEEYYGTTGYRTDPLKADTDGDGLWDGWQDSIHNYVYDAGEAKGELGYRQAGTGKWGTNPLNKDSDADAIPDGVEASYGLNPTNAADAIQDLDQDGLTNLAEYRLSVQKGTNYDLDADGVPNFSDTDDDGDGILTIDEVAYGLDPYLASDAAGDLDGDGVTNQFEYTYDQNPASGGLKLDMSDPDTDGDGLTDGQEIALGTNPLLEDTDGDTLSDGDEVSGWFVYILVDDTAIEKHVTSDPTRRNSDADRLDDSQEYLKTDPRNPDTDGDGLWDDSSYEDDSLEPESIPPRLGTPAQVTVLEWGWLGFIPVVVHTWLTVSVEATDNAAVANVTFRLIDTNAEIVRTTPEPNSVYKATFEIDFWNDYVLGYQVELKAFDRAGNVMGTQIGGGLEYIIEGLVASFLSFFLGPELAGGVIGFFVGFATGLFEDLTIFLHIGEMWDAIQQLPKLIGQIVGNPSILLEMVTGMLTGILAKGNMINPYGASSMTAGDFGNLLVKFFWHIFDSSVVVPSLPNPNSDLFNLAFTVSHLIGYFVQQFIVGTGLAKIAGKLKQASEITAVGKRLSEAAQVVKSVATKVKEIATGVARGLGRGVSTITSGILERLGLKLSERATAGTGRIVSKLGPEADDLLEELGRHGDDMVEDLFYKLDEAPPQIQRKIQKLIDRLEKDPKGASGELKYLSENFDQVQDMSLYLKVQNTGVIKPDFLLKDGTLVEIKNWDKALFESPFMKQKLAEQLRRYSKFTGGNGLVKLKLVGEYDATFLRNLKGDLVNMIGGNGNWLDISCFT